MLQYFKSVKRRGPDFPSDSSVVVKKQVTESIMPADAPRRRRSKKRPFKSTMSSRVKGPIIQRGPELKVVDTSIANADITTTASITLVNGVAEGGSVNQRDGRMVKFKSVQFRCLLQRLLNQENRDAVRIALVWDNCPNGVIATAAQMGFASIFEFPEVTTKQRFTYLFNRVYTPGMFVLASQAVSPDSIAIDEYLRLGLVTQYQSGSNGIADIQNGALYFCVIGANVTTEGSRLDGNSTLRVTYVDV